MIKHKSRGKEVAVRLCQRWQNQRGRSKDDGSKSQEDHKFKAVWTTVNSRSSGALDETLSQYQKTKTNKKKISQMWGSLSRLSSGIVI